MSTTILSESIGETDKGKTISAYTLDNETGLRATFLDFGGILLELEVPDRIGIPDDITLGFDSIENYVNNNNCHFGTIEGRFANRIANAKFKIGKKTYKLDANQGDHTLHGGEKGFSTQLFKGKIKKGETGEELILSLKSPDGQMGFPGKLDFQVKISLNEQNGLVYEYEAKSDAPTHVNFTAHPYFNLISQDAGSIRSHSVQVFSKEFLEIDEDGIPTGKTLKVVDSPFDLREPAVLDPRLDSPDPQIEIVKGFDHNFVLNPKRNFKTDPVAVVTEESTGRKMEVFTTEPGIQFYTGNSLDGSINGKSGSAVEKHFGFCLETQHYPDSPNHPAFPSTLLKPGEIYKSRTEYRFSKLS